MTRKDRIRVLLVDDSPEFVEWAEEFLSGYPRIDFAGWAFSATDALDLMLSVDLDLVLMDLSLPRVDGLDATRHIKARRDAPHVVILTLHDAPDYRAAALAAGADGFVPKARLAVELAPLLERLYGS